MRDDPVTLRRTLDRRARGGRARSLRDLRASAQDAANQGLRAGIAEKVTAARQANATAMQQYTWDQRTEMLEDGIVKDTRVDMVNWVNGQYQKSLVSNEGPSLPRFGIRKRVAEAKQKEIQEYLSGLKAQLEQYTMGTSPQLLAFFNKAQVSGPDASGTDRPFRRQRGLAGRLDDALGQRGDPQGREGVHRDERIQGNPVTMNATFNTLATGLSYMNYRGHPDSGQADGGPGLQLQLQPEQLRWPCGERTTSNRFVLLSVGVALAASFAFGQAAAPTPSPRKKPAPKAAPAPRPTPETRAVDILKASCAKLAAAGSMSFTALGAYEVPSLWGPPSDLRPHLRSRPSAAGQARGHHRRRRAADRVLRRRQGHDELPPGREPRRRHGCAALDRRDAGEALRRRRHLLPVHRRDRRGSVEGHVGRADGRLLRRRIHARRRCGDRRRRLRDQRRLHPDVDRQGRPAPEDGSRDVPRRSAAAAAFGAVLELAVEPGGRPGEVHDDEGRRRRQDSVQPSEDEVGPSGGRQAGRRRRRPPRIPRPLPNPSKEVFP